MPKPIASKLTIAGCAVMNAKSHSALLFVTGQRLAVTGVTNVLFDCYFVMVTCNGGLNLPRRVLRHQPRLPLVPRQRVLP